MLIEFKVANYRSIRAEQTLSMVASNYSDELPQNLISCDDIPGMKGTKLVKAVALYGANASGKSNIVAALRFFAEFVRDSATKLQPGASTGAQPFKLDPACLTQPSKFEITAVINGIRTLYGLELTNERVMSEYLVAYPKGRPQVWFERDWDATKETYLWSKPTENFSETSSLAKQTRENASLISVAAQFNQADATSIWQWFSSNISLLDLGNSQPTWTLTLDLLRTQEGRKQIVEALSSADLGIADARLRKNLLFILKRKLEGKEDKPQSKLVQSLFKKRTGAEEFRPELLHRGANDQLIGLDFRREESNGTHRFFNLFGHWDLASQGKGILVLDELEVSLHPMLVHSLMGRFFAKQQSDAQLVFTTHNPLLLDQTLLRRDQIWFTEKDQEGATRLYPLTDFKPRKDESLVKGYLAGRYGGIPFIPEGLKF